MTLMVRFRKNVSMLCWMNVRGKEGEGYREQGQRAMIHNTGQLEGLYGSTSTSAKEDEPSTRP
jgi:hypothetical protein